MVVPKWGWLRGGYLGCISAVRRMLGDIGPNIVHGQGTERYCALAAAYSGFPNVITIHGNMRAVARTLNARFGSFHWITAQLERYIIPRTGGVFCNSQYTEQQVTGLATETWRVPNALLPIYFETEIPRSRAELPALLCIGNFGPRKRQIEVLDCMKHVHARGKRFQVWFAGKGIETDYGRRFDERLRSLDYQCAHYLGDLPPRDLINRIDAASALIHFPTEEAFGLVVAEALARNRKLFAAAVGGIVDIARGVEMAELFDCDDFAGLEHAVERWLDCGAPIPSGARDQMQQRYSPATIAHRHLEIYQEFLKSRRK